MELLKGEKPQEKCTYASCVPLPWCESLVGVSRLLRKKSYLEQGTGDALSAKKGQQRLRLDPVSKRWTIVHTNAS